MLDVMPIRSPSFSGHESFPLRYLWLKKGYDAIAESSSFFGTEDAMVKLGTGKNMVRAIRHWGLACDMWEEVNLTRGREVKPSDIGQELLSNEGWDPFLEEIGTIWLLHWMLVTNPDRASSWTYLFGRPKGNRFTREELVGELEAWVKEQNIRKTKRSSLKRDIDVLVRSYTRAKAIKGIVPEDSLDSPFVQLDLIRPAMEKGQFEIVEGAHPSLPNDIFEVGLAEYYERIRPMRTKGVFADRGQAQQTSGSISLDELLYAPCSPGRTFRLSEEALVERLHQLVSEQGSRYVFDETAGIRQLLIPKGVPSTIEILQRHYSKNASQEAA